MFDKRVQLRLAVILCTVLFSSIELPGLSDFGLPPETKQHILMIDASPREVFLRLSLAFRDMGYEIDEWVGRDVYANKLFPAQKSPNWLKVSLVDVDGKTRAVIKSMEEAAPSGVLVDIGLILKSISTESGTARDWINRLSQIRRLAYLCKQDFGHDIQPGKIGLPVQDDVYKTISAMGLEISSDPAEASLNIILNGDTSSAMYRPLGDSTSIPRREHTGAQLNGSVSVVMDGATIGFRSFRKSISPPSFTGGGRSSPSDAPFRKLYEEVDLKKLLTEAISDMLGPSPLLRMLGSDEEELRYLGISVLETSKDEFSLEPLLAILRSDKVWSIRAAAAHALGQLKALAAVGPLVEALQTDKDYLVRSAAAGALGELKALDAVEPIIEALQKEKETSLRASAARALGEIGDKRAVEHLIPVLRDKGENLWYQAQLWETVAKALGDLGDHRALGPLIETFEFTYGPRQPIANNYELKVTIREAIKKIAGKDFRDAQEARRWWNKNSRRYGELNSKR